MNKILKPTSGCVDMWSVYQNISELSFINPDLLALKYGRTIEMEAANEFFELMKKKHKHFVILECGLFLDKANCFIGASPDRLITCDSCEDACVEIKRPLSINYEKPNDKNLDYLYKGDSEIKLKTNHSYFTQCILQAAITNRKLCCFVVWTPHGKVIDTISLDGIMWKDITEKLIAFIKIFILEIFSENS